MNTETSVDFHNWFLLYTLPGGECRLEQRIKKVMHGDFPLYLPRRKIYHKIRGRFETVIRPLFPGYLFVYKDIETLVSKSYSSCLNGHLHPVRFGNSYANVDSNEMAAIIKLAGKDGLVDVSNGIVDENRSVTITNGPLKDVPGKLIYINKRKRKAKVAVEVMHRKMNVTLGLDLVTLGSVAQ